MLVVAGALLRCAPLAVLALRRVARLASHPATTAKLHTLFLHGALSRHNVKIAMAWRTRNAHYRRIEIRRRHFNEVAAKLGIGKDAEAIIEELLTSTPRVIAGVARILPKDFPADVADAVFRGLEESAQTLRDQRGE